MRKYILTDPDGRTPGGQVLQPGKHIQTQDDRRTLFSAIGKCCCDSPLVAALVSPFSPPAARLFMINCWNVAVDPNQAQSYTVIKEMTPVPKVSLEEQLSFALLVVAGVFKNHEFSTFAENWCSGADRSAAAAKAILKLAAEEERAASDLEALAAWGEAGHNDIATIKARDDESSRALHVAKAVARFAETPEDRTTVLAAVANALGDVHKLEHALDLDGFARKVVGSKNVVEPRVLGAA